MKKLTVPSYAFLFLIGVVFLLSIVSFGSKETTSKLENRALAIKPTFNREEYFSGRFFEGLEEYVSDHIPYRDTFVAEKIAFDQLHGVEPYTMALEPRDDLLPSKDNRYDRYKTQNQNLRVLSYGDKLFANFIFQEDLINPYIESINSFKRKHERIEFHVQNVPLSIAMEEKDFSLVSDPQDMAIEYVRKKLSETIHVINSLPTLQEKGDDYLYFRTDHHWTSRGAYLAARDFVSSLELEMEPLISYTRRDVEGFFGYQSRQYPVKRVMERADTIELYTKGNENPGTQLYYYDDEGMLKHYYQPMFKTDIIRDNPSYGIFFEGDHAIVTMENNEAKSDKSLLIIKDSYANIYAPWLYPYFSKIVMVDPRHYRGSLDDLFEEFGTTDLLFLQSLNSITTPGYVEDFMTLLNR